MVTLYRSFGHRHNAASAQRLCLCLSLQGRVKAKAKKLLHMITLVLLSTVGAPHEKRDAIQCTIHVLNTCN